MDNATLLNKLRNNRALYEHTVAQVSETRLIEPSGKDQHSGKDIIAHLTAWEQRAIQWLKTAARGETPHSPEPGATWDDMDRLNAQSFAQNKHRTLLEVREASQQSFQELLELIQAFSEDELTVPRPFAWVWQGDPPEKGKPLWKSILAGPCYAHYQDHLYDFLVRTDPALRFIPDLTIIQQYAGTYSHERIGALAFRISGRDLLLRMPWQEQEIPGLALDNTHIAYEDFGLITFHTTPDGAVSSLEWWTNLFTPIA